MTGPGIPAVPEDRLCRAAHAKAAWLLDHAGNN